MGRAPGERRIGSFRLQPSLQPTQDCISHASVQRSRDALIVGPGDGFQIVAHSRWREDLAAVCALCECRRETGRILRGRNLTIGGAVDDKDRDFDFGGQSCRIQRELGFQEWPEIAGIQSSKAGGNIERHFAGRQNLRANALIRIEEELALFGSCLLLFQKP